MTVRTRFAPSPTGYLHIGGARTALFSWLYARKHQGEFVLRIEDTDRERSTEESVQAILDGMAWLGLDYDQGPFYQTQRFDRYAEIIQQLLDSGHAYYCSCSKERLETLREEQMAAKQKPRYDGYCRERTDVEPKGSVVRFRNPQSGEVVVDDLIRGKVVVQNSELDDLIIARSDGTPTYNLTVVVDDMDMGITDVIRGDDHLNNTPRQINILKALGAEPPRYAHVPMILGADGKRLSKRHGAVSVMQYKEEGYLSAALLNYLVRLGWSHGDQEIFSIEEMIELFDLKDVNKAASAFNTEKAIWLNQQYIQSAATDSIVPVFEEYMQSAGVKLSDGPDSAMVIEAMRERAKTIIELGDSSLCFYQEFKEYDEKAAKKNFKAAALEPLKCALKHLAAVDDWRVEKLHDAVNAAVEELEVGFGKVAQPLRVALVGRANSPSIDITLNLIGKSRSLQRIQRACDYIASQS